MITALLIFLLFGCIGKKDQKAKITNVPKSVDTLTDSQYTWQHEDHLVNRPDKINESVGPTGDKTQIPTGKENHRGSLTHKDPAPSQKHFSDTQDVRSNNKEESFQDITAQTSEEIELHESFDDQLQKYVDASGNVDYVRWKKDISELQSYLEKLKKNPPQEDWTRNKIMAYWINAYNAFTIKLILDNYPLESIMNLSGGKVWDKEWIEIDGEALSLNDIEHEILRKKYTDARIHFAVNCAAASCPPLWNRAFNGGNLNTSLDMRTASFINDRSYNQISPSKARLSKIFDWYRSDFGDLIKYINRFSEVKVRETAQLEFNEYDWSLNEQ